MQRYYHFEVILFSPSDRLVEVQKLARDVRLCLYSPECPITNGNTDMIEALQPSLNPALNLDK